MCIRQLMRCYFQARDKKREVVKQAMINRSRIVKYWLKIKGYCQRVSCTNQSAKC